MSTKTKSDDIENLDDGSVVELRETGQVYVIEKGKLLSIPDMHTFLANQYDPKSVKTVPTLSLMARFPGGGDVQVPTKTLPSGRLPFHGYDYVQGAKSHHMDTNGNLDPSTGYVTASTHTWTDTWFGGFHGAAYVIFFDKEGQPLAQTQWHRFGVDGSAIGNSNRTDFWNETIDKNVASRADSACTFHAWAADDILTRLTKAYEIGKKLAEIYALAQSMGVGATITKKP